MDGGDDGDDGCVDDVDTVRVDEKVGDVLVGMAADRRVLLGLGIVAVNKAEALNKEEASTDSNPQMMPLLFL